MHFVRIPQPAVSLQAFYSTEEPNAEGKYEYRVPGHLYVMSRDFYIGKDEEVVSIIGKLKTYLQRQATIFKSLVINCHGIVNTKEEAVGLKLGQGIYEKDLYLFSQLKGMFKKIYLPCCFIANGTSGVNICKSISKFSGAIVIAPQELQLRDLDEKTPKNKIDHFEGSVFRFKPNGHYRRSVWLSNYEDDE